MIFSGYEPSVAAIWFSFAATMLLLAAGMRRAVRNARSATTDEDRRRADGWMKAGVALTMVAIALFDAML